MAHSSSFKLNSTHRDTEELQSANRQATPAYPSTRNGTVATQAEGSSLYLPMTRQNTSRELFKDALHVVSSWNNFLGPDPLLREFL